MATKLKTRELTFRYNSALFFPDPQTGSFKEARQGDLYKPIRAKLMQLDGLVNCTVERYTVTVEYNPHVTTAKVVTGWVKVCFQFFWKDNRYFESLGPVEIGRRPLKLTRVVENHPMMQLVIRPSTDFYRDAGTMVYSTENLTGRCLLQARDMLMNFDGVRSVNFTRGFVTITYETRVAKSRRKLLQHVMKIMGEMSVHPDCFPLHKAGGRITFKHEWLKAGVPVM